jgi:hypothetical protein
MGSMVSRSAAGPMNRSVTTYSTLRVSSWSIIERAWSSTTAWVTLSSPESWAGSMATACATTSVNLARRVCSPAAPRSGSRDA